MLEKHDVPILMYHSVTDTPTAATQTLSVSRAMFHAQLCYLRRNGFSGLTFGEFCRRRRTGESLPLRPIVLTFDDGYADFAENAMPVLAEHGFPATVFVTTGWLRNASSIVVDPAPDRMLSQHQLAEVAGAGIEVAAHSHTHPQLDQVSQPRLHAELTVSRKILEDKIGGPVLSLAYPYGYSNKHVRELTRDSGYLQAASVANKAAPPNFDPFSVPRLTIRRSTSLARFSRVANQRWLAIHYAPAHALTAGWATVRRVRRGVGSSQRSFVSSLDREGIR